MFTLRPVAAAPSSAPVLIYSCLERRDLADFPLHFQPDLSSPVGPEPLTHLCFAQLHDFSRPGCESENSLGSEDPSDSAVLTGGRVDGVPGELSHEINTRCYIGSRAQADVAQLEIHERYDIKGSYVDRHVELPNKGARLPPTPFGTFTGKLCS